MDNENLIKSIKQLCQNKNISVSQLENDLGFSPSLISRWKDNNPNIDRIIDIADYFHVSIDEVVGYNSNINDAFLNKLYEQTTDGSIVWEDAQTMNNRGLLVKQYSDFYIPSTHIGDNEKETTYAICYNSGYIAMYAYHFYGQMLHPFNLILFIQPSNSALLIDQHYKKEELMGLWVKILNSLGDDTPDEVKAEDLKMSFLNEAAKTKESNKVSSKKNSSLKIDAEKLQQAILTDPNNPKNYRKFR